MTPPRHRPQPFYTSPNPTPKGPHDHGKHRRSPPKAYRDPAHGAGPSPGANDQPSAQLTISSWTIRSGLATPPSIPNYADNLPALIPYAGITTGEIIGHRLWLVTKDLSLCSLAHVFIWEPGATIEGKLDEMVDYSLSPLFSKPILGGVYSFAAKYRAKAELAGANIGPLPVILYNTNFHGPVVIYGIARGRIKCWGEVIEHEHGYRAQFAKLTSIDDVIGPVDINLLRERYKV